MTEYAQEFNSELEVLRARLCADSVKVVALSGYSSLDLERGEPLVVVNAKDRRDVWQGLKAGLWDVVGLCRAAAAIFGA